MKKLYHRKKGFVFQKIYLYRIFGILPFKSFFFENKKKEKQKIASIIKRTRASNIHFVMIQIFSAEINDLIKFEKC